ncbi:MAG TPA: type I-U CRISPR-associated helicase/endonuclease Cas3 [Bryobacteraceae bacterium]|jgi:CRISPR-associated endonuclease/helicase Cas3
MSEHSLHVSDFSSFFQEVNGGLSPFPWQERLAFTVCRAQRWPSCLDLPTGTGKTAVLEIAVFHLALEARRLAQRSAPIRIVFVVDRRLIVDQAERRAEQIRECLCAAPPGSVAHKVATELVFLSGDPNTPLMVAKLRGGIPQETDWARTPVQPTILLSTVDQVGSRLMFRGYGVSDSMKPVHAGLLGSDCLTFLDEAHLSEPYRQTLGWVHRYREEPWSEVKARPWSVVTLSATPAEAKNSEDEESRFRLEMEDRENETIQRRVTAGKPAELRILSGDHAEAYITAAKEHASLGLDKILIVVNRVDLARAVFRKLQIDQERAVLMIGRVREHERSRIVNVDLAEGMRRETPSKFFAVATQCIEAGADLDFDGLVTQLAPLDALRQRFGRLNRTGRDIPARAAILVSKEELRPKKPDPLYGDRAQEAWNLLQKIAQSEASRKIVDFGIAPLEKALEGHPTEQACTKKANAPVIPPGYVDLWARTSPIPAADPELSLFLHGPESGPADVEIVWRKDLFRSDLPVGSDDKVQAARIDQLIQRMALVPPRAAETLSVPIWRVRDWLAHKTSTAAQMADIEGQPQQGDSDSIGRPVLRWRGPTDERTQPIWSKDIRPGDVIVVPVEYGGCDEWGWTGDDQSILDYDVALEAAEQYGAAKVALRFHPALFQEPVWAQIRSVVTTTENYPDLVSGILELEELPIKIREPLDSIKDQIEDLVAYDQDPAEGFILLGRRPGKKSPGKASTEDESSGLDSLKPATLSDHTAAVLDQVRSFADRAGIEGRLKSSLELAAELHDAGKADLRFQESMTNRQAVPVILAKYTRRSLGPLGEKHLRESVGLPARWRHEALSVRVAVEDSRLANDGLDPELVLWLIGTHHGFGRPFFPHDDCLDDQPRSIRTMTGERLNLPAASGPQRLDFD